jgi:hypothetical protein
VNQVLQVSEGTMSPRFILEVNLVPPLAISIHRQVSDNSPDHLEHWVSPSYNNEQ